MKILNNIVKGATSQFGREFGRAGANYILKGANSYTITEKSDFTGRVKPSDSPIVKAVKEINKIKFATTNKANVSRLIEITDLINPHLTFKGTESLNQISDLSELVNTYNNKFEHGEVLIEENYSDKSLDYLKEKTREFEISMDEFNNQLKSFVDENIRIEEKKLKHKSKATILCLPGPGSIGIHKFYLRQHGYGFLYLIFFFTFIPTVLGIIEFIQFISMSEKSFNQKHNQEYVYFKQFK